MSEQVLDREHELPPMVVQQLPAMTAEQRAAFDEEYERRRKSGPWSWFTWVIHFHFGYIEGRWGLNVLYWFGNAATLGLWWLFEGIFKVKGRIANQRRETAIAVLSDIRAVSAPATG